MNPKKKKKICVHGLGHIGLPMACILANKGYEVLGIDINKKMLDRLQNGKIIHSEPGLQEILVKAIQNGNLKLSTTPAETDIHIIAVPTLLDQNKHADISQLKAAIDTIKPYLRAHDLILIESTCPIGTTRILAQNLYKSCPKISLAYCPERVLPGNILHELIQNDRVIGGIDEASTLQAKNFYKSFIHGKIYPVKVETAEAVKLCENAYRDINVAYANELSMIADRLHLNIYELINLANKHPRVHILEPGAGVGGHCIAVDPWYLVSSAPDLALLITQARATNINKTNWILEKIRESIQQKKAQVVVCLGLTYKANNSDTRESPALTIVETLKQEIEVIAIDPYVLHTTPLYEAISRSDIIVGLVAHQTFLNIPSAILEGKVILDFAGIFK